MKNFYSIFCTPIDPSRNDFRAKVQLDQSGHIVSTPKPKVDGNQEAGTEVGESDANEVQSEERDLGRDEENDSFNEDAWSCAMGQLHPPVVVDSTTVSHRRISSRGRKSGNWEITPEIMAVASGSIENISGMNNDSTSNTHER